MSRSIFTETESLHSWYLLYFIQNNFVLNIAYLVRASLNSLYIPLSVLRVAQLSSKCCTFNRENEISLVALNRSFTVCMILSLLSPRISYWQTEEGTQGVWVELSNWGLYTLTLTKIVLSATLLKRGPYFMTLIYFVLQTTFYRKHFKLTSCIKIFCENWWYTHVDCSLSTFWITPGAKKPTHFKMSESEIVSLGWKSHPVQQHVPTGLNKRDCSLLIASLPTLLKAFGPNRHSFQDIK